MVSTERYSRRIDSEPELVCLQATGSRRPSPTMLRYVKICASLLMAAVDTGEVSPLLDFIDIAAQDGVEMRDIFAAAQNVVVERLEPCTAVKLNTYWKAMLAVSARVLPLPVFSPSQLEGLLSAVPA